MQIFENHSQGSPNEAENAVKFSLPKSSRYSTPLRNHQSLQNKKTLPAATVEDVKKNNIRKARNKRKERKIIKELGEKPVYYIKAGSDGSSNRTRKRHPLGTSVKVSNIAHPWIKVLPKIHKPSKEMREIVSVGKEWKYLLKNF